METQTTAGRQSSQPQIIQFFRESITSRMLSWVLVFALLNLTGCRNYYKISRLENPPNPETIRSIKSPIKNLLLISGNNVFQLKQVVMENGYITGIAEPLPNYNRHKTTKAYGPNRYRINKESNLLLDVQIYAPNFSPAADNSFALPFDSIDVVEFYEHHGLASFGSHLLGVFVGITLIFGVLILLFILFGDVNVSFF